METLNIGNEIKKCKCKASSIEFEPCGEDLFDLKLTNCKYTHDKDKCVIIAECWNCGDVVEIDSAMTGHVDSDEIIMISDVKKVFIKTMPKGIANIKVEFDFKLEKKSAKKLKSNLVLIGENETHYFYIKRQDIKLRHTSTSFIKPVEYNQKLGGLFSKQLVIHGHTEASFGKLKIVNLPSNNIKNWTKEMPFERFMIAMNILKVKVTNTNFI